MYEGRDIREWVGFIAGANILHTELQASCYIFQKHLTWKNDAKNNNI